jgi:hypothetical protein
MSTLLEWAHTVEIRLAPLPAREQLMEKVQDHWVASRMTAAHELHLHANRLELEARAPAEITLVDMVDYVRKEYSSYTNLLTELADHAQAAGLIGTREYEDAWDLLLRRTDANICNTLGISFGEYERVRADKAHTL